MNCGRMLWSTVVLTFFFWGPAAAAPPFGVPSVYPAAVPVGTQGTVLVSIDISNPATIPGSVVVQRLDASGRVLGVVGALNDSANNGDLAAGDHLFAGRISVNEASLGVVRLRVSAALRGVLQRVSSEVFTLEVTPATVPNTVARAGSSEVVFDPRSQGNILPNQVLVTFLQGTTITEVQAALASSGGQLIGRLPELGIYQALFPGSTSAAQLNSIIDSLRQRPSVLSAEPIMQGTVAASPNDPRRGEQWGLDSIGAQAAWDITTGWPIGVAVIDSGVKASHEDLAGKVVAGVDFVERDLDPSDDNGHGTAVAGILAANSNNGKGIAGVCWGCAVISEKIAKANRKTLSHEAAAAIVDAIALGARVLNLSYGGNSYSLAEKSAVDYALQRNRVVVAAAGNDGTSSKYFPAAFDGVIAVGAATQSDQRRSDSNYGAWVSVFAPGDQILSTCGVAVNPIYWLDATCLNPLPTDYQTVSGTSFAAPFVSGTAALMLSVNPYLTATEIKAILVGTARINNGLALLDAAAAVRAARDSLPTGVGPGYRMSGFNMSRTNSTPVRTPLTRPTSFQELNGSVGGRLYRTGDDGTLYLINATTLYAYSSTGQLRWTFNLANLHNVAIGPTGTVYASTTSSVYALNPATGQPLWLNPYTVSSPGNLAGPLAVGPSGTVYFHTSGSTVGVTPLLTAINPDGTRKWERAAGVTNANPVLSSDETSVYLMSSIVDAVRISAATGQILSTAACAPRGPVSVYTPWNTVITNDSNNDFLSFTPDLQTCATVSGLQGPAAGVTAVTQNESLIFYYWGDGKIGAVSRQGTWRWKSSEPLTVWFADGNSTVFTTRVTNTNEILALDAATGQERWRYTLPAGIDGLYPAGDGRLYVTAAGKLYRSR